MLEPRTNTLILDGDLFEEITEDFVLPSKCPQELILRSNEGILRGLVGEALLPGEPLKDVIDLVQLLLHGRLLLGGSLLDGFLDVLHLLAEEGSLKVLVANVVSDVVDLVDNSLNGFVNREVSTLRSSNCSRIERRSNLRRFFRSLRLKRFHVFIRLHTQESVGAFIHTKFE